MENKTQRRPSMWKFIVFSLIGAFLFLAPIPDGEGAFNIPLGIIISWLNGVFGGISFGEYAPDTTAGNWDFRYMLALVAITASFLLTLIAYLFKPKFIMDNPKVKEVFYSSPIYFISKAVAVAVIWMLFLNVGPAFVIASWTGDVMIGLVAGLMTIFLVLGPAIPFLTDFGLMEFIGVLIRKVVRALFTLPGRASIDLMASWFGSSAAGVIITRDQHAQGFYTGREAAVVAVNFALVSVPFSFVIADLVGVEQHFWAFYGIIALTCIILAIVMPRIWPLRNLKDEYLADVGKQIEEEAPANISTGTYALQLASKRAGQTTAGDVVKTGLNSYLNIFMDLIPIILAWGTIAIVLVETTPIFDWISLPMAHYLNLLGVAGAFDVAPATLVGFVDMYIPGLLVGGAPAATRFIIGALSIVQIIYLAETGALIIKSKIPLGIGKLFIIFMMRTIIALPILVLLTNLFFRY